PGSGCPARSSTAAQASPATAVTSATASHTGSAPATLPASLVSRARSDWLPSQPTKPVRPPLKNKPPSHHRAESAGATTKPAATVAANAAPATAAARDPLGSSLIPPAPPTPAPFHHRLAPDRRVSGWHRSQMISAIRTRLTWPRYRV